MSAVDEYRKQYETFREGDSAYDVLDLADAAIAELEAAREAMRHTITHQTSIIDHAITSEEHLRDRAEQAEAELAALREQLRLANIDCFNNEAELAALKAFMCDECQSAWAAREEGK